MQKLAKKDIEKLVNEIKTFLEKYKLAGDVSIYYNNKVERSRTKYDEEYNSHYTWETTENVDPHNYFEYAAYNHILSMSFEGALYDSLNYSGYKVEAFLNIFRKYGLYYELGNAWNLTCFLSDDMEVEYTVYEQPKPIYYLFRSNRENNPLELQNIMDKWYILSTQVGDCGSCVLGAGFKFEWKGEKYFMSAQSPYQGSISWETYKDEIKQMLIDVGATEIYYDWGNMD